MDTMGAMRRGLDQSDDYIQEDLFPDATQTSAGTELTDSAVTTILFSLLGLSALRSIGFKTVCRLYDLQILHDLPNCSNAEVLDRLNRGRLRVREELLEMLTVRRREVLETGRSLAQTYAKRNISFSVLGHKSYPSRLRRMSTPPRWIFFLGDELATEADPIVGVVGTRRASMAGKKAAYVLAREMALRDVVVLSGLARGIDLAAHQGATDCWGRSVAVLGHGINRVHEVNDGALAAKILWCGGAIVSEYLPDDPPSASNYLRRNELQAAMSRVVVPVECPEMQSGTGATIRRAINLDTPVLGVFFSSQSEPALLKTRQNLDRLGIVSLSVDEGQMDDLWRYLKERFMVKSVDETREQRRLRFFAHIAEEVRQEGRFLGLDDELVRGLLDYLAKGLATLQKRRDATDDQGIGV
jgi:DNA processing protein